MFNDDCLFENFSDLDATSLCLTSSDHPWISDMLRELNEKQFPPDDLLTDAVSEFMKFKTEFSDIDLLPDEAIESLLLDEDLRTNTIASPTLPSDVLSSDITSGYSSRSLSSGTPSPVNRSPTKLHSLSGDSDVSGSHSVAKMPSPQKNSDASLKVSTSISKPVVYQAVVGSNKRVVLNTVSSVGSSHVRLIVRPNRTTNAPVKVSSGSQLTSSDLQHFRSVGKPQPCTSRDQVSSERTATDQVSPTSVSFKKENCANLSTAHSAQLSSSSSESEQRDNIDDDGVAAFADVYSHPPYRAVCSQTPCRFRLSDPVKFPFVRSQSPSCFTEPAYDHGHCYQDHRLSVGINRDQINGRMRSPLRSDRSDVGQSGVLILTEEEKRTLLAEGYPVPTKLPLSKQEERNLKRVRRKIKNKISAQESRRKKKEYVEALERKLNSCAQENMELKRRNDNLESTNRSLLGQLRLMQQLLNKPKNNTASGCSVSITSSDPPKSHSRNEVNAGSGSRSSSTCLMVFALCFAALFAGQPTNFNYPASLESGLTFGPLHPGIFNSLVSSRTSGLASSSFRQAGYTWSTSQRVASVKQDIFHNQSSFPWFPWLRLPLQCPYTDRLSGTGLLLQKESTKTGGYDGNSYSVRETVSKSRLLGAPNEFEQPVASTESFWSYVFGAVALQKKPIGAICSPSMQNNFEATAIYPFERFHNKTIMG